MRSRVAGWVSLAFLVGMIAGAQDAPGPAPQAPPNAGAHTGRGSGRGGGWMGGMGGRGVGGTVSEVAANYYTIKTLTGETFAVHYSANTRVLKQPPRPAGADAMRVPPEEIKATDIHVGDAIMAMGEMDVASKSVGAVTVVKLDPERAREMREMQMNFGKTWLAGRVTEVKDTKVTLHSQIDDADHTFVADENTMFRRRRVPVTLADIEVGANVRVEGTVKQGVFVASGVNVMGPPVSGRPTPREGPAPR